MTKDEKQVAAMADVATKAIILKDGAGKALAPVTKVEQVVGIEDFINGQYKEGTQIKLTAGEGENAGKIVISHAALDAAVNVSDPVAATKLGANMQVPVITVDGNGHVTASELKTVALPTTIELPATIADDNTVANIDYVKKAVARLENALYYQGTVSSQDDIDDIEAPAVGDVYVVKAEFGNFEIGDMLIYNGTGWDAIQANIKGAVTAESDLDADTLVLGAGGHAVKKLANGTEGQHLVINADGKPEWSDNLNINSLTLTDGTEGHAIEYDPEGEATTVTVEGDGVVTVATSAANGKITVSHAVSGVTEGTFGETQNAVFGGNIAIPTVTVDANGHVTAAGTVNVALPAVASSNVLTDSATATEAADGTFLNHVSQGAIAGSVEFKGAGITVAGKDGALTFAHPEKTVETSDGAAVTLAPEYTAVAAGEKTVGYNDTLAASVDIVSVSTDEYGHVDATTTTALSIDLTGLRMFAAAQVGDKKLTAANAAATLVFGNGFDVDTDNKIIATLQYEYVEDDPQA